MTGMTKLQYILKTFLHYFRANLLVALGVMVSTMVLTGSLIIGDSVRYSLKQAAFYRLGETTHLVAVNERYFRQEMAAEMETANPEIKATPLLLLEGVAVADGGQNRLNRVQIVGVDDGFDWFAQTSIYSELESDEILVSQNIAERLQVNAGDNILVRIKKASLIPMNAPFVSDEETSVSLRATIKAVVDKEQLGRFHLKNSQTAPYNIFLSIEKLNELMEFEGKANQILVSTDLESHAVLEAVHNNLTPEDAGLSVKEIEETNETEVSTERVFLEDRVADMLKSLPEASPLLTYFVNEIRKPDAHSSEPASKSIPYSFVSSLTGDALKDNEIILNQWAADDLDAQVGDSIRLNYLEIGPLRQLQENESEFVLKEIVPMEEPWADQTRMPYLPGLSDAGHCREWEAGVPIDLDAIRDKDEDYWDDWKGTPKAYISLNKAEEIWSNRFGNYTAVRYPTEEFDIENYNESFAQMIRPSDLGMVVEPIREQGINAAQNGTDFSGLFLGLSFFLLAAAVILTALLFRLNLETRTEEVGILAALGFQQKQVRNFFVWEGLVVSFFGGLLGLVVSVLYTSLVFRILNTLWYEIVRTDVLLIQIYPTTLVLGLLISVLVSLFAVFISLRRFQKRQTAELQKQTESKVKKGAGIILDGLLFLSLIAAIAIFLLQFLGSGELNTSMFFLSGGLLLIGLLLIFRRILIRFESRNEISLGMGKLSQINLTRNKGRSLTVIILFALGTFLVVSTGSNKLDLFANAEDKSSGTGGFLYFAETTMPVLFNLNNPDKRAEEGIYEDFNAVQFRKVEGDDASCLNLNRIKQPAVLGVDPEAMHGRFSFATKMKGYEMDDPWLALDEKLDDGAVPAIADQTVIQWGLGLKVGDELLYQNELGDTIRLKLIAGTTPSIFQGFVIISNKHFLQNYPTSSGTSVFLIDGEIENQEAISDELQSVFRDYGWEMESTARRLVEFYSVTNTYLSIFLALGALGLILGTIGLTVILARTMLERRQEIALLQAIGFDNRPVFQIISTEYLLLLFSGVLIGFITAVVATLPALLSANTDVSVSTVVLVVSLILLNGFIWIYGLTWFSLRKKRLAAGLRVE